MTRQARINLREQGLSTQAIRRRRRSRRLGTLMLTIAGITAIAGWPLFGSSIFSAIRIKDQPQSLVIIAYALLTISTITLILGFWYLLLAQMERLARIVDADELEADPLAQHHCICGWGLDSDDHFCRHCGRQVDSPSSSPAPPAEESASA